MLAAFLGIAGWFSSPEKSVAQNMSGAFVAAAIPVGSLSTYAVAGFGVGGHSRFFPVERLAVGLNASMQYYFSDASNFTIVPIRGNVEYFFTDEGARYRPFAGGDLGLYIATYGNGVRARFGMAPGAGILFELSDYISMHFQAKYNFIFDAPVMMSIEPSVGFSYTIY